MSDAAQLRAALRRIERRARLHPNAGWHPCAKELIAYHGGRLGVRRTAHLQQHLGLCCGCADHLLELEHFLEPARPEPVTAGTDASWQELRAWLTEDKPDAPQTSPICGG